MTSLPVPTFLPVPTVPPVFGSLLYTIIYTTNSYPLSRKGRIGRNNAVIAMSYAVPTLNYPLGTGGNADGESPEFTVKDTGFAA